MVRCDNACSTLEKADLLFKFISSSIVGVDTDGEVYKILSGLLNVAKESSCSTATAPSSKTSQTIYYSKNGDFNSNGFIVDQYDLETGAIAPTNSSSAPYDQADNVVFLIDGFYHIIRQADYYNAVSERDETNNSIEDNRNGRSGKSGIPGLIIHVTNSVNHLKGGSFVKHIN